MRQGRNTNPDRDGTYLLILPYWAAFIDYTVEGGWNTSYNLNDGKLNNKHAFVPEKPFVWFDKEEYVKEIFKNDGEN